MIQYSIGELTLDWLSNLYSSNFYPLPINKTYIDICPILLLIIFRSKKYVLVPTTKIIKRKQDLNTSISVMGRNLSYVLNSITFSKIVWCLPCWQLVGFYWFLRQSIVQALEPDNSRESLNSTCWTKSTESLCLALTASSYCGNPKVVMAGKFNLSAANKKEHDV